MEVGSHLPLGAGSRCFPAWEVRRGQRCLLTPLCLRPALLALSPGFIEVFTHVSKLLLFGICFWRLIPH